MIGSGSNLSRRGVAFNSVPLGLSQTRATETPAQDVNLRDNLQEESASAIGAPGLLVDETAAIPEEFHEPNLPPTLMAAVKTNGIFWLFKVARQAVRAKMQLRRCNSLGRWVRVRGKVRVHNEGTIKIAERVRFRSEGAISELVAWKGGLIEIGEATTINYGTSISAAGSVKIGRNCLIGTYVNIMDCNFHNVTDHTWNMDSEPVVIGDDVWLGNRCMIMKGVTVGEGAVVAACSLVTKDVPPHTMVVGVPARVVQHL